MTATQTSQRDRSRDAWSGFDVRLPRPAVHGSAAVRLAARASLERLLGLWDYLVDARVGIIRSVYEVPLDDDDPDFFHYFSQACDTARFSTLSNFAQNGGASTDRWVAIAKALGEAVERYCSAIFDYDDLVDAPYEALHQRATPPESFALYRAEQYAAEAFPWKPFTRTAPVAWTEAHSLLHRAPVLVPAAMVFVPYFYLRSRADTPIVQPISTGLACGTSLVDAAIGGLCEVIERDAFTLFWQARLSPPSVRAETIPASCAELVERMQAVNVAVRILDITTDVAVPTLLTVALSDSCQSPAVAVAAATDPCPEVALRKSLEELVHTRKFAKQVMHGMPPIPMDVAAGHPAVADARAHLRFYCPQEARTLVDFAWQGGRECDFAEVVNASCADRAVQLDRLVELFAGRDLEPIVRELTTSDVAALGLHVVRAVVPGMHPLFMGHQNRALGGRRLYEVPRLLGHRGLQPGEADNPYPHPFP